nr:MAG TPA: hypothetical protein [Caudoviricetes sp.]
MRAAWLSPSPLFSRRRVASVLPTRRRAIIPLESRFRRTEA